MSASIDAIRKVKLSSIVLPLKTAISDAKVFTGRQKPMTEVVFLFAEIATESGHEGIGFSYSKRAGAPPSTPMLARSRITSLVKTPTISLVSMTNCCGQALPSAVPGWQLKL